MLVREEVAGVDAASRSCDREVLGGQSGVDLSKRPLKPGEGIFYVD
jgi:hypothetical protein